MKMKNKKRAMDVDQQKSRFKVKKQKAKADHKVQGDPAPAQQLRSVGDSFAYALSKALSNVKSLKGSQKGFLGQETKELDPKEYVAKDKLNLKC